MPKVPAASREDTIVKTDVDRRELGPGKGRDRICYILAASIRWLSMMAIELSCNYIVLKRYHMRVFLSANVQAGPPSFPPSA